MSKKVISIILFVIVLGIVSGLGFFLYQNTQVDTLNTSVTQNETIHLLFSFGYEDDSQRKHISSFFILLEPSVKQVGVLEIPSYLAIYDRDSSSYVPIDYYYNQGGYKSYYNVLKQELGIGDVNYLFADSQMLINFIDLIGGTQMFIIESENADVSFSDERTLDTSRVGNVNLDGPDIVEHISKIETSNNTLLFKSSQRKEFISSILRELQKKNEILGSRAIQKRLKNVVFTSLSFANISNINNLLSEYNLDAIFYQRINGTITEIEGVDFKENVLFISSEIGSIRKIVTFFEKQIKESITQNANNKITITILNGTVVNGLARKAKSLYEAAGFQVLSIGNSSQNDIKKTVLIDRTGNQVRVGLAAQVINARNVITDITSVDSAGSSITLILGADFDGENVR